MAETIWEDQQSSDLLLSRMSACKTCLAGQVVLLHWARGLFGSTSSAVAADQIIVKTHCSTKPVEL